MMRKTDTLTDAPALRSPYKLILIVALIIPAANALTIGWGMLFCDYYAIYSTLFLSFKNVLQVLYQIVRFAALACVFMTIGFIAGKRGFVKALAPAGVSSLCSAGAAAVGLGVDALMICWGLTDRSEFLPFGDRFLPHLMLASVDLLILTLVEVVVVVFFSLVASARGRKRMLDARSPFVITAYVIFAAYTVISIVATVRNFKTYTQETNVFVEYVLPILLNLFYGGVMVVAGNFFRQILYIYFYERKDQKEKKKTVGKNESV